MAVFGEIIAGPVLAGLAFVTGHQATQKPADPCKAPTFRIESANIAALPGPNSAACKAARDAQQQSPSTMKEEKAK